jgi:HEPN domain.
MDDFIKELALYRIEKAKMDLEASKILLDNGLYSQSLNRSYYSIFHAVRAVLAFEQFDSKNILVLLLILIDILLIRVFLIENIQRF